MRTILILAWFATVATPQEWPVRSVNLIPGKGRTDEGMKTLLRIEANTLVCYSGKGRSCEIPFWSMTGLWHDQRVRNLAAAYGDGGGSCYGQGCAAELLVLAALMPFHVRWEYVTVQWRDQRVTRTTIFRFRKSGFPAFESAVSVRTGLSFGDLANQRDATRMEIERRKLAALPVRFASGTFIRNEPFRGGLYQILVIERGPAGGELYIFRGKRLDARKPPWVVPVSIIASPGNSDNPEPEYSKRGRWKNLEAIRIPGQTIRIAP